MSKEEKTTLLAENRRAGFNYAIEESLECGIVLKGAEVKSLRERHLSFRDAYALLKDGELYIIGLRIENYPQATHDILDPERTRKLLLHKREITRLQKKMQNASLNLIPLKLYMKNGRVKVLIGIGKGKSNIDKRETIKDREVKRELRRVLKRG
jgi:SsrA-binding protein